MDSKSSVVGSPKRLPANSGRSNTGEDRKMGMSLQSQRQPLHRLSTHEVKERRARGLGCVQPPLVALMCASSVRTCCAPSIPSSFPSLSPWFCSDNISTHLETRGTRPVASRSQAFLYLEANVCQPERS